MDNNEFNKYIKDRYEYQINWYSVNASKNKKFYMYFQWGVIILSASLPVMISAIKKSNEWITIMISVVLAIGTTGLKTFKFQENWINYRTISETLKKEKYFYDANIDEYSKVSDKESLFVDRVESLISRENSLWVTTHMQQENEKKNKTS